MTVSQTLNHLNDSNYDDDIMVTDIPQGEFPAVTDITLPDGSTTREVTVTIMSLEASPGGAMPVNTGLFVRGADEKAVKVTVVGTDGKEMATNTQDYS